MKYLAAVVTFLFMSTDTLGANSATRWLRPGRKVAFCTKPSTSFRIASHSNRVSQRRTSELQMVDMSAVVVGGAAGIGGFAFGGVFVWLTEQAAERAEERGSDVTSEETKARLAQSFTSQFTDNEIESTDLDDVVTRMEKAIAAAEGITVDQLESKKKERVVIDDGW